MQTAENYRLKLRLKEQESAQAEKTRENLQNVIFELQNQLGEWQRRVTEVPVRSEFVGAISGRFERSEKDANLEAENEILKLRKENQRLESVIELNKSEGEKLECEKGKLVQQIVKMEQKIDEFQGIFAGKERKIDQLETENKRLRLRVNGLIQQVIECRNVIEGDRSVVVSQVKVSPVRRSNVEFQGIQGENHSNSGQKRSNSSEKHANWSGKGESRTENSGFNSSLYKEFKGGVSEESPTKVALNHARSKRQVNLSSTQPDVVIASQVNQEMSISEPEERPKSFVHTVDFGLNDDDLVRDVEPQGDENYKTPVQEGHLQEDDLIMVQREKTQVQLDSFEEFSNEQEEQQGGAEQYYQQEEINDEEEPQYFSPMGSGYEEIDKIKVQKLQSHEKEGGLEDDISNILAQSKNSDQSKFSYQVDDRGFDGGDYDMI